MTTDWTRRPTPKPPAELSTMTPQEAWNAALDAAEEVAWWDAHDGDGGPTTDFDDLRIEQ